MPWPAAHTLSRASAVIALVVALALPALAAPPAPPASVPDGFFADPGADRAPTPTLEEASVEDVINRLIQAYGGPVTVKAVRGIFAKGLITAHLRGDRGIYSQYLLRERMLRVDIAYSQSSEMRLLNGYKGWRGNGETRPAPVDGPPLLAMLYQYKSLTLPSGIASGSYVITYSGIGAVDGSIVDLLALEDLDGPPMTVYVERASGLILKVTGNFLIEGRPHTLSAEFADYRPLGETRVPYHITTYAAGRKLADLYLKEYELNPIMIPAIFEP